MTSTVWHWIFGQRHAKMQFMQHALTYAPLNLWAMKKLQWSAYYCHCCLSLLLQSHLTRWVCTYYKLQCCLQYCFPLILYVSVCCDCKYFLKKADLICFSIHLRHVWVHRREKLRFDSLRVDCRYPPNFNWTCSSSIPFQRHLMSCESLDVFGFQTPRIESVSETGRRGHQASSVDIICPSICIFSSQNTSVFQKSVEITQSYTANHSERFWTIGQSFFNCCVMCPTMPHRKLLRGATRPSRTSAMLVRWVRFEFWGAEHLYTDITDYTVR
jgi:hypothetical protein